MKKLLAWALAGVAALGLAGTTRADAPPKTDAPPAKADKPAAAPLTDESLGQMLQAMGYDYKPSQSSDGKTTIYRLNFDQDGWSWHLDVALSSDKENLWISTPLVTLADENVPPAALLRLLEENENIGPTTIYFDKNNKQIGLELALLNHGGITPAVFRARLNDFLADAKSTMKPCDFAKPAEKKADAGQAAKDGKAGDGK
jgi:hypothetical protein